MKKDVADKWTNALRSGAYKQAKGQLRVCGEDWERTPSDSAFCCLGVLCDLYTQQHSQEEDAKWGLNGAVRPATWDRGEVFMGEDSHLPSSVREWAGMRSDIGLLSRTEFVGAVVAKNLVDLNDNGCSFAVIADVIDTHVEEL